MATPTAQRPSCPRAVLLLLLAFLTAHRDLLNLGFLKSVMLIHSTSDIVLIRPGNQEVTSILNVLSKHVPESGR